jgi:hypothetical protein
MDHQPEHAQQERNQQPTRPLPKQYDATFSILPSGKLTSPAPLQQAPVTTKSSLSFGRSGAMGISAEMGNLCRYWLEMRRNRHIGVRIWPVRKAVGRPRKRAPRERVRGIEPPPKAWEAFILPLNYTRELFRHFQSRPGEGVSQAGRDSLITLKIRSLQSNFQGPDLGSLCGFH